jgi:hypothetical protein
MLAKTGFFASDEKELLRLLNLLSDIKDLYEYIPIKESYNNYKGEVE